MFKRAIFLPGNGGCSTQDNWFPELKRELIKDNIDVVDAVFPDPELAREDRWIPFLENELKVEADDLLVGHSTGAIAAMRYAEKHSIYGSVLVGVYHTHLDMESEKKAGYFDRPWEWQQIRDNQQWICIFASQDDPWIPITEARHVHQNLNCEYHEFLDQGHFGGDYFKESFPELTQTIRSQKNKEPRPNAD